MSENPVGFLRPQGGEPFGKKLISMSEPSGEWTLQRINKYEQATKFIDFCL
ncbi:hypothetical protein JHK86_038912 [Glycine max]|nr:hypothetical protein JHK86_038912 [Glycine max]